MKNIYSENFVEQLFDKMSRTYALMNYITSFGFSKRWRKQCVKDLEIEPSSVTVDLMTGMGECWSYIFQNQSKEGELIALDFSEGMIRHARKLKEKYSQQSISILKENVFQNSIPTDHADYVISTFGLKTFNDLQLHKLGKEIHRILKPNGKLSIIEVSVPQNLFLRVAYMFYLKRIIPFLGKFFLGDISTYKMLGIYTEKFQNAQRAAIIFKEMGFNITYQSYFFGCATGFTASKKK